jgi:predicted NUDIX family phosphoesterase/adenylate kinase family enzyme
MASEFLIVAEQVLGLRRKPMRPAEIVDVGFSEGLFSNNVSGKTPWQTMKSKLSQDVRKNGGASRFVRTAPGLFFLRSLISDSDEVFEATPYVKPVSNERVLVVHQGVFQKIVGFQGLHDRWKRMKKALLAPGACVYVDRRAAEESEDYKQVLTYVAITRRGKLLCFKRGNYNRVEDYLRGSRCVGFGGHVIEDDTKLLPLFPSNDRGITECVIRELSEELNLPKQDHDRLLDGEGLECVGILNDDSSSIGRKHFAFVFRYEVGDSSYWDDPRRGEKSITQLQWLIDKDQQLPIWEFEYWSQLVIRKMFSGLVSRRQSYKLVRRKPLQPPHLLCVVGEVGSGKSTTTRFLREAFGYEEINTGRVVAEILGIPPVPQTNRIEFQRQAYEFISSPSGPQRLAKMVAKRAAKVQSGLALVDGVRQLRTLEMLQNEVGRKRLGMIYVFTPPDIAFSFFRDRELKGINFSDYLRIRTAEVEREVPEMLAKADGVIYNWTGEMFLKNTIREMMYELGTERALG